MSRDQRILSNLRAKGIHPSNATPDQVRDAALRSMSAVEVVRGVGGATVAVVTTRAGMVVSAETRAARDAQCSACPHHASSSHGRSCLKCGCSGPSFDAKLNSPLFGCPDDPPRFQPVRLTVHGQ